MKHKLLIPVIVALACVTTVTSCRENKSEDISFSTVQQGACYVLEGSGEVFGQDSDILFVDSVSLLMPERLGSCDLTELRDSIMSIALDTTGVPVNTAVDTWLDKSADESGWKARRLPTTPSDGGGMFAGFTYSYGYIVNLAPEILVYCIQIDSYSPGAAHGMSGHSYLNYSLEGEGSMITLSKIFTPEGLKALPARIAEQAEALSDRIGTTQVTDLPAGGNFYISSEGEIVFSYQPYEIASYAQGTIDIPFYPYELVDFMTPYGVSLFHLEDI